MNLFDEQYFEGRCRHACFGLIRVVILICLLGFHSVVCRAGFFSAERFDSPNHRISINVLEDDEGRVNLEIQRQEKRVVMVNVGLTMSESHASFTNRLDISLSSLSSTTQKYALPTGKKRDRTHEATIGLMSVRNEFGYMATLELCLTDTALAFRWHLQGDGAATILADMTALSMSATRAIWASPFSSSYECLYQAIQPSGLSGSYVLPFLIQQTNDVWLLITESGVDSDSRSCGSHLGYSATSGILSLKLAHSISSSYPWTLPWRIFIVSEDVSDIVESTIVEDVYTPSESLDWSWVIPGVVSFPWASDTAINNKPDRLRAYIDFAAEMGWSWIEFDSGLVQSDGATSLDYWMTEPWVFEIVAYARSRGVAVYGWDDYNKLDTLEERNLRLRRLAELGFQGIKVDYLNSDSSLRFAQQEAIIEDCAKYRLMVSFHGCSIPRGLQRRWPHVMTMEAVLGGEFYTWADPVSHPTASHNAILPFTRNVVGSMDYTPTRFSAPYRGSRITTIGHEMALAVIFESGWQCMVDSPEVYAAKMASGFLADLPSSWDDTVFLSGIPGEYVAIARRKGWKWWVAAINGSASLSREFTIPTDFLISNLTYDAEIYYDVPATGDVTNIFMTVTYTNLLPVHIPPSGGWGMRLSVVPVDYDEWAETFGLTNVESSRQDIPAGAVDRNGISYMLGKSPYEYSQVISTRNIDIQNRGVTSLQWTRPAGYAGASPIPEFSHDLRNWFRADNIFNFIVNEDLQTGNEKLVLKSLNLEAQSMFLRLVSDDNPRKQPFLSQSDNMTRAGWLPIYAKNPHFENNSPLPDPGFLIGFPDTNSWTGGGLMDLSNPSGVKDRNLLNFFNEPTRKRHQTVAWLMSTVSPLKQSFPEYLQRNSRYLVKATIGHRGDDPDNTGFPNDFSVQFKAGDVHIPWTSQSFYRPAPNTFMDVLLYLDVPDDESATGIGSQISLEFHCASAGQVLIDDIEVYREISYEH